MGNYKKFTCSLCTMIPEENLNNEFNNEDCQPDEVFEAFQDERKVQGGKADNMRRMFNKFKTQSFLTDNDQTDTDKQADPEELA